MERKNKKLFDNIDVENLFSQWHKHVRLFTKDLNQDCVLEYIKNTKITHFDSSKHKEVLNFTNTNKCIEILRNITEEKNKINFFKLLKERDNLHPREYQRGINIEQIFEPVKNDNYHPILFLELYKKHYIIDGRTRLYCCIFLNKPAKVRIITDYLLKRNCIED